VGRNREGKDIEVGLIPHLTYYYITENNEEENLKEAKFITFSADEENFPIAVGRNSSVSIRPFRVTWDGEVYIEHGYFNGIIESEEGYIGGWIIDKDRIYDENE
jgi:hypothetical protein